MRSKLAITVIALVSVTGVCRGIVAAGTALHNSPSWLAIAGAALPAAAESYYCTNETFPSIQTNEYLGVVGNLNFGVGSFAGFAKADDTYSGPPLWPSCADAVAWMPAAGSITTTDQPVTRTITFNGFLCQLTQIRVAARQYLDRSGYASGVLIIRALGQGGEQLGDPVARELSYADGCMTIDTGFPAGTAGIEITYDRGSELGIVEMTYCCSLGEPNACSPVFWGQPKNFNRWVGVSPSDDFDATFGVDILTRDITLLNALRGNGRGVNRLAREGVAALLNANSPDVSFTYSPDEVIALVQAGDLGALLDANNLGCPITPSPR